MDDILETACLGYKSWKTVISYLKKDTGLQSALEYCSVRMSGRHTNPQLWDRRDSCPMIGQVPRWNLCHVLYGATLIRDEFRTILTLTYD